MSEWISVRDHYPDLEDWVLVVTPYKSFYVARLYENGKWEVNETGCGCCSKNISVAYWMPLPSLLNDKNAETPS